MFRALVPRRPFVTVALLGTCVGLAASAAPARAQAPVTVGFNSLQTPSDFNFVANCYQEAGFQVSATGLACGAAGPRDTFAAYGPTAGGAYTGSTALFLNTTASDTVAITRVGSGTFSMQSIAFGPFAGVGSLTSPLTFNLIGSVGNTTIVSQMISLLGSSSLQTFALQRFTGVTSVKFAAFDPFGEPVQFDNIVLTPSATVPEPTTVALLGAGLLAVGAAARRRRTRA